MDLGLQGKKAIVAGASRGIGKAIAIDLAREGVDMAIVSRSQADLDKTAQEIRELLGKEDFPNETLMGAKLLYEEKGFIVNFLDRSVNIEFCLGCFQSNRR